MRSLSNQVDVESGFWRPHGASLAHFKRRDLSTRAVRIALSIAMASTSAMSLGSRLVPSGATRGRRDVRGVKIGSTRAGPVSCTEGARGAGKGFGGRPTPRSARVVVSRAVINTAVMHLPGLGADGTTWDPLGLGRDKTGGDGDDDWMRDEWVSDAIAQGNGETSVMQVSRAPSVNAMRGPKGNDDFFGSFMGGNLPGKIATILALLVVSRVGTYIPISGVDRVAFAESLQGGGSVLSYVDTLTGGSISKLGIFSLGIVPYINSSIIFQVGNTTMTVDKRRSSTCSPSPFLSSKNWKPSRLAVMRPFGLVRLTRAVRRAP